MLSKRSLLPFLLIVFASTAALGNTVEYVRLKVTSHPSPPGEEANDNSLELPVDSNGRIHAFRLPFITGEDHEVTIIGHLTDYLDRVEIVRNHSIIRTIRKDDLVVGHTDEHGGKGKIVFNLRARDLPNSGDHFQVHVRFAIEVAGHDKLDCKVVKRGTIQLARWRFGAGEALPESETTASGITHEDLTRGRTYTLRFKCFKCPQSIQASDGVNKKLLGQDAPSVSVTGDGIFRTITATFLLASKVAGGNVRDLIQFADDGVGNISGGWGNYVYLRLEHPLPGRSTTPTGRLQTNLEHVRFRGFGGGPSSQPPLPPPSPSPVCDGAAPAPTVAPVIEGPADGATCVGQPVGDRASISFEFGDVRSACGNAAFQIEIQRLDAGCTPVNWTGPGSGFDNFDQCWIADKNTSFHSEVLDRSTRYRWRTRANSRSSVAGAGSWSNFQTFTTGGVPGVPVFQSQDPRQPAEGSQVHLGDAVVATTLPISWASSGCGQESFDLKVFEDDQLVTAMRGAGNTTTVPVKRDHDFRLELVVTTLWGSSPTATLRFSTLR